MRAARRWHCSNLSIASAARGRLGVGLYARGHAPQPARCARNASPEVKRRARVAVDEVPERSHVNAAECWPIQRCKRSGLNRPDSISNDAYVCRNVCATGRSRRRRLLHVVQRGYVLQHITPSMRCVRLCAAGPLLRCVVAAQHDCRWSVAAHNQSPSRNARSASDGWYLPGLAPSGAILSTACCLRAGSACW